jgi:putative PEP-CTERM system TPR-repeat lipoprotein
MRERTSSFVLTVFLAGTALLHPGAAAAQSAGASRNYEQALTEFRNGNLEQAVIALKQALEEAPSLLPAHVLVARVYLSVGEPAAAEDALKRARSLGADPEIVWPLRAEALFAQTKYAELLALTPQSGLGADAQATVHFYRGQSHLEKSDFLNAELEFNKAAALTPSVAMPQVALAMSALRQGDIFKAEARAIKATRVAPDDAGAWNVIGDVRHVQGELAAAVEAYDTALDREPKHYDARLSRAGVLLDLGRFEESEQDVQALREARPLDPRPVYLESVLLAKRKRSTEAREALRRAAALLDEMGAVALDRSMQLVLLAGLANFELGDLEQAQGHLSRYVERYPGQPGPRKLLGAVLLRNGRHAEAISVLEPALQKAPNDYKLLSLLGTAYMDSGRHGIATRYLEKAATLSYGAPEVRARLALSRVGAGFEQQGLQELWDLFHEKPEQYQSIGLTLAALELKRGNFERASEVAERLREADDANLTVLNILGAARLGAGDLAAARVHFERVLALDGKFFPARVNLARLEAQQGNLDQARAIYLEALKQRPESVQAMVDLARLERRRGNANDSMRWLQKAQGTEPNSRAVALAMVDLLIDSGDTPEAQRIAREAQAREPEDMEVLEALARTHLRSNRNELALGVYEEMARAAGFNADALYRVARLQADAGGDGVAMYSLSKALSADAAHLPSRLMLTRLQIRAGKLEEAAAGAEALLANRPDLASAHRLQGDVLMASGRAPDAVARYRRALELEPGSQHALRVYGATAVAGEQRSAREFLEGWVRDHPDDLVALRAMADGQLGAGQLDEARSSYEAILEKLPTDAATLNNLAFILDRQSDAGALDMARRALAAAPEDPAVLDTVGWMMVRRGDVEAGLRHLRDAHSRAASNPEIRFHIASALAALERPEEARQELRRALESPLPFEGIADAKALLERLGQ